MKKKPVVVGPLACCFLPSVCSDKEDGGSIPQHTGLGGVDAVGVFKGDQGSRLKANGAPDPYKCEGF